MSGTRLAHYYAEQLFRHNAPGKIPAEDFTSIFAERRFAESVPYFASMGG